MRPQLFQFFDVGFPAYFAMLVTGFALATAIATMGARRIGQNPDVIVDLALLALLLGVVGGRIFHVLFDGYFWDYVHLCTDPGAVDWPISQAQCASDRYAGVWDAQKNVCHPVTADCFAWAKFWAGGLVYYGGLVFATIGGLWMLRRDRFPWGKASDLSAVGIALGLGFGRMGCLLAGCCFGVSHDGPLGMSFPPFSPASDAQAKLGELAGRGAWSHAVHPTQIYEAAISLAIAAAAMLYIQPRKRYDGQVFLWFLAAYALGRFGLEFWRADDRGALFGLSTSQIIGLLIVIAVYALHRRLIRRGEGPGPLAESEA